MAGITSAGSDQRTQNELRPDRLADVIGQAHAKLLMRRAIDTAHERQTPLDHTLLVAASGTGKSTFSHVVANELGVDVFEVEAPVSIDTLLELRTTMRRCDVLKIEEIHQQGIGDRRGLSAATTPEVLYAVMEDRVIPTSSGVLEYPHITVIGTTTDEGLLPDAFINRFALRPRLVPYGAEELRQIALMNCRKLDLRVTHAALDVFAKACRGVPRQINNFVKNAVILTPHGGLCNRAIADEVLTINGITHDGLTADMQAMLTFLYRRASQRNQQTGEVKYQASVNTIATAIGKSRDSKAIALRVEPFLIERGFIQVTHGGRRLTDAGIWRARQLLGEVV